MRAGVALAVLAAALLPARCITGQDPEVIAPGEALHVGPAVPLASPQTPYPLGPPLVEPCRVIYPEQRTIRWRDPTALPQVPLPPSLPPPTVSSPAPTQPLYLALDEAIRIAIANDRVVRILAGATAVNSGRTIYDPAIANTRIDQELARFDPTLVVNNNWDHLEIPSAVFDPPGDPTGNTVIRGLTTDQHRLNVGLAKENPLGGQWQLGIDATEQRRRPGIFPLNPQTDSSVEMSYTQPLLQGFGRKANLAPVVVARIETERSFFQLKDSLQEQVRGVIEAYWNLVSARTAVKARQFLVDQAESSNRLLEAQMRVGIADIFDVAQTRNTLAQFKAQLVTAKADVLQREAALRNILGLPPWDGSQIVPTTEPVFDRYQPEWYELVALAAERRPDLIELKLILEADEQLRMQANNNALPRLDAVALYRWNGLEGEMPDGNGLSTGPGQFTDWTLGVNFSVPIGLRGPRAQLRERELIIARDRANFDQGLHAASHDLATTVRSLDQAFEQYLAFKEAREAAELNVAQRRGERAAGRLIELDERVALTDLGNSIASEAASLTAYNTLLAELELQTGTILETHGIWFYEERYGSIGPLGRIFKPVCYPQATAPTPNADRYPPGNRPAENAFHLPDAGPRRLPPPSLPEPLPPP
jgi:outer membrane protein TolC